MIWAKVDTFIVFQHIQKEHHSSMYYSYKSGAL